MALGPQNRDASRKHTTGVSDPVHGDPCLSGDGKGGNTGSPYRGDWLQRATREELIAILENVNCGIVVMENLHGETLYINPACFNMTGYDLKEVATTRAAKKVMFPSDKKGRSEAKHLENMLNSGQRNFLQRITRKDGDTTVCEVRDVVLPEGVVVGAWTDVTRRESAEEELKARESQFRLFFEQSFDAALLVERNSIVDCNQAALDMMCCPDKTMLLGRTLWDLSPQGVQDGVITAAKADRMMRAAVRKKRLRFQWTLRRTNGETFPAEVTVAATKLEGEDMLYVLIRDIMTWKESEKAMLTTKEELAKRVRERTGALSNANKELRKRTGQLTDVNRKLKESREELRHLYEHLNRAREEERTRLAREVHDELGHFLMGLKMDLSYMRKGLPLSGQPAQQTTAMEQQLDQALNVVSQICSDLRPHVLDQLGLASAVEWHLDGFAKKTGLSCTTEISGDFPPIRKEQAIVLFRVLQEATSNILRHSGATEVRVSLKAGADVVVLRIEDNGRGITKEQLASPESFGVIGIRERVRFWGGKTNFRGAKKRGTVITISIPTNGAHAGLSTRGDLRTRKRGAS